MFLPCGYETESHSLDVNFSEVYPQTIDSTLACSSSDSVSFDYDFPVFNSDIELSSSPLEPPVLSESSPALSESSPVLSESPLLVDVPNPSVPNIALPPQWSGVFFTLPPRVETKGVCDSAPVSCKER